MKSDFPFLMAGLAGIVFFHDCCRVGAGEGRGRGGSGGREGERSGEETGNGKGMKGRGLNKGRGKVKMEEGNGVRKRGY